MSLGEAGADIFTALYAILFTIELSWHLFLDLLMIAAAVSALMLSILSKPSYLRCATDICLSILLHLGIQLFDLFSQS